MTDFMYAILEALLTLSLLRVLITIQLGYIWCPLRLTLTFSGLLWVRFLLKWLFREGGFAFLPTIVNYVRLQSQRSLIMSWSTTVMLERSKSGSLRWCGISSFHPDSVIDFIQFAAFWGNCPKIRKIIMAIVYGYL